MRTARLLATPEQIADEERAERLRALRAGERATEQAPAQQPLPACCM